MIPTIEPIVVPQITHDQLKLYAEASGDFNPIHLDDEVAKKAGLPGRIVHGMLSMAFLGRQAESVARQLGGRVVSMQTRFKNMTMPGDQITVTAKIKEATESGQWSVHLEARNQKGDLTTMGEVKVSK